MLLRDGRERLRDGVPVHARVDGLRLLARERQLPLQIHLGGVRGGGCGAKRGIRWVRLRRAKMQKKGAGDRAAGRQAARREPTPAAACCCSSASSWRMRDSRRSASSAALRACSAAALPPPSALRFAGPSSTLRTRPAKLSEQRDSPASDSLGLTQTNMSALESPPSESCGGRARSGESGAGAGSKWRREGRQAGERLGWEGQPCLEEECQLGVAEGDVLSLRHKALHAVAERREGLVDVLRLLEPVALRSDTDGQRKARPKQNIPLTHTRSDSPSRALE